MALLWCAAAAAFALEPPPRLFNQDALVTLLGQLRSFSERIKQGVDESTAELQQRLPEMWRELEALEDQMQRRLPALREQLQALERELRAWELPPSRPAPPPARLIEV